MIDAPDEIIEDIINAKYNNKIWIKLISNFIFSFLKQNEKFINLIILIFNEIIIS